MLPINHQGEVLVKDGCSYLIPMEKIGMLWKNYGKAMEFLFWGSVRTLKNETCNFQFGIGNADEEEEDFNISIIINT